MADDEVAGMKKEILRMENILTDYPGGNNLRNLYFQMYEGEIMGLIGINKYGLDHFLELICRNSTLKFGRVYFQEKIVNHHGFVRNTVNRVHVIGRNDSLLHNLTVIDNIFVLRKGGKNFFINRKALRREVQYYMNHFQISIPPSEKVKYLNEYEQCTIELLKAYILGAKLVIYDGLSGRLGDSVEQKVMVILKKMTQEGMSAVIVGNHPEELTPYCDRLALFKDGKIIKVLSRKEISEHRFEIYQSSSGSGSVNDLPTVMKRSIRMEDWNTENLKHFSLSLQAGECVMLYDRSNKIQTDILGRLCGENRESSGCIVIREDGKEKVLADHFLDRDVAVIEENPLEKMLFFQHSYLGNLCFLLEKKMPAVNITKKIKKSIQQEYREILGEEVMEKNISALEKTSLYNLMYYRIHLLNPKLVFIIQPFFNTDLRIRYHIVNLIRVLKEAGIAVIILTSNIADAETVVDRFCIVEDGERKKEYAKNEFESARVDI